MRMGERVNISQYRNLSSCILMGTAHILMGTVRIAHILMGTVRIAHTLMGTVRIVHIQCTCINGHCTHINGHC